MDTTTNPPKRRRTEDDAAPVVKGSAEEASVHCLPLFLQLAIPFLRAGDLPPLATVSRACRKAALASYQKRLETPILLSRDESATLLLMPDNKPKEETPPCFHAQNLWNQTEASLDRYSWDDAWDTPLTGSVQQLACHESNGHWKIRWNAGPLLLLEWKSAILQIPDDLLHMRYELADFQRRGSSLVIIVRKLTSGGYRIDLFGLVYDLSTAKSPEAIIHPLLVQGLLDKPQKEKWSNDSFLGQMARSGNGKVIAVVTSMIAPDYADYDNFGFEADNDKSAQVTVYDIAEKGFVKRCAAIAEACGDVDCTAFKVSLSTCGSLLSILNMEAYPEQGGGWWLYHTTNIQEGNNLCEQVVKIQNTSSDDSTDFYIDQGIDVHFTPDNEICVQLSPPSNQYKDKFVKKLEQTKDTLGLSRSIGVVINCSRD